MQRTRETRGARTLGVSALAAALMAASFALPAQARSIRLDAGSVVPVKLDTQLSSADAEKGDTFTTTVLNDTGQNYGLPDGTRIDGYVRTVHPHAGNKPGVLDLAFTRLRLPDGRSYPIDGSLIGLDNSSVHRTSDGRLIATPSKKNNRLTYVGYGAGAGLIAGILTKHTLEDTLLGGGLGYLFGALSPGQRSNVRDVTLKPGTQFGVRLDRSVALNTNEEGEQQGYQYGEGGAQYHRSQGAYPYNQNNHGYNGDNAYNNTAVDNNLGIGVMVGDQNVNFNSNVMPVMSHGVVLVPARPVLDTANISFTYRVHGRYIRATGDGGTVRLALGSRIAVVNDSRRVRLSAPAQMLNGTLYVPMDFFHLVTGRNVHFDQGSNTVVIDMPSQQDMQNYGQ